MKTSKELIVKHCEKRGCEAKMCKVSRCHSMLERKGHKVATGGERENDDSLSCEPVPI